MFFPLPQCVSHRRQSTFCVHPGLSVGQRPGQPPAQSPVLGALVDLVGTSLLGLLSFFPLGSLAGMFIHLNGTAHSKNVLETWSCLGISCFHFPAHGSNPFSVLFRAIYSSCRASVMDGSPHHLPSLCPSLQEGPLSVNSRELATSPWHPRLLLQLRPLFSVTGSAWSCGSQLSWVVAT